MHAAKRIVVCILSVSRRHCRTVGFKRSERERVASKRLCRCEIQRKIKRKGKQSKRNQPARRRKRMPACVSQPPLRSLPATTPGKRRESFEYFQLDYDRRRKVLFSEESQSQVNINSKHKSH